MQLLHGESTKKKKNSKVLILSVSCSYSITFIFNITTLFFSHTRPILRDSCEFFHREEEKKGVAEKTQDKKPRLRPCRQRPRHKPFQGIIGYASSKQCSVRWYGLGVSHMSLHFFRVFRFFICLLTKKKAVNGIMLQLEVKTMR